MQASFRTCSLARSTSGAGRRHEHSHVGADILDHPNEGFDGLHVDRATPTLAVDDERGVGHAEDPAPDKHVDLATAAAAPARQANVALYRCRVAGEEGEDVRDSVLVVPILAPRIHV